MTIRLNVAAVIVREDKILLVEFDDETGLHYNLPGVESNLVNQSMKPCGAKF